MCGSHEHNEAKEAYNMERISYDAPILFFDIHDSYAWQSSSDDVISPVINYSNNPSSRKSYSNAH